MGLLTGFSLIRKISKGRLGNIYLLFYKIKTTFNDFPISGVEILYFALKIVFSYLKGQQKKEKKFIC